MKGGNIYMTVNESKQSCGGEESAKGSTICHTREAGQEIREKYSPAAMQRLGLTLNSLNATFQAPRWRIAVKDWNSFHIPQAWLTVTERVKREGLDKLLSRVEEAVLLLLLLPPQGTHTRWRSCGVEGVWHVTCLLTEHGQTLYLITNTSYWNGHLHSWTCPIMFSDDRYCASSAKHM